MEMKMNKMIQKLNKKSNWMRPKILFRFGYHR